MNSHDRKRIEIAEAVGWTNIEIFRDKPYGFPGGRKAAYKNPVPDYLNDLNAMHEIEKTLDEMECGFYLDNIVEVCGASEYGEYDMDLMRILRATAAQRAEAFIKTKSRKCNAANAAGEPPAPENKL